MYKLLGVAQMSNKDGVVASVIDLGNPIKKNGFGFSCDKLFIWGDEAKKLLDPKLINVEFDVIWRRSYSGAAVVDKIEI